MKALFLRSVKPEEHEETVENIVLTKDEQGNDTIDPFEGWYDDYDSDSTQAEIEETKAATGFDLSDYDEYVNGHSSTITRNIKNTDGFNHYSFDYDFSVTHKQARTMTEEKRPFVVAKNGKKKSIAEEIDTIYHPAVKMKIEDKSVQRLGFVLADDKAKQFKLKDKKKKNFKGIISDEYLILKKKPFNTKKVGYIKLQESTETKNLYVEVVQGRGYGWLIAFLGILCVLGLIIFTRDYKDWHFNLDGLTIYKTKEVTEYKESELEISLNATPVLKDGYVNLNLSSEPVDGITYIARLYTEENELVYESEELKAGEEVDKIELITELLVGEHECTLICETYRNGNYLGTLESNLVLQVKDGEQ